MKASHQTKGASTFGAAKRRTRKSVVSGLLVAGLFALGALMIAPAVSQAGSISVGISVGIAPPAIPVYAQPPCPAPGYLWTPGYWAYDPADGYYWVPGTWVMAPQPGLLWTPGYWGWSGAAFMWHLGYWGPHVGFYGGVNYGFGYNGRGYDGGQWRGREFFYNRAVNHFGAGHFEHVYDHPVANNFAVNRVSYEGGRGGLNARPTGGELAAEHDRHLEATSTQHRQEMAAQHDRSQFASENHGRPAVAATGKPGEFRGAGAVQASRAGGPVNAAQYQHANTAHAGAAGRPAAGNSYQARNNAHPGYQPGGHTANPGGGGNHPFMTAHQNAPASRSNNSRETATNHQPAFHQTRPAQEHNPRESRGATPHGAAAPHNERAPQHQANESHGNPSHGNQAHEEPHHR